MAQKLAEAAALSVLVQSALIFRPNPDCCNALTVLSWQSMLGMLDTLASQEN